MRKKLWAIPIMIVTAMGIAAVPLIGQEQEAAASQEDKTTVLEDSFASIQKEYETAYQEFLTEYRAEEDANKKAELVVKKLPKIDTYADRVFEVVSKAPDAEDAAEALAWVANGTQSDEMRSKAINMLLDRYLDSEELSNVASRMAYATPSKAAEESLKLIMTKSPHKEVQGKAAYALVSYFGNFDRYQNTDYVKGTDADAIKKEVDALIETIKTDYADVKLYGSVTLGAKIEATIFERERLQIGMKVPDIVGEDIDGTEFKLSDYEGKVVVLDFWGDW